MKNLFIIGNEKIWFKKNNYYSANVDFKSIVEGLSKYFIANLLARSTFRQETFKIEHNSIKTASNIFSYIFNIILSFNNIRKNRYLIISISPYTFIAFLILFFFSNNIYLYLRSDGFKEYEKILGKKWIFLYSFMYFIFLKKAKIISCEESLVQKKFFFLVRPSELDELWFKNRKFLVKSKKIKILYVGRIRIEKGIFNFLDLFSKLDKRFELTIVGDIYNKKFDIKNVKYFNFYSNIGDLINQYDINHVLVLPSYTESHPKVVYESLARLRPVLIFDDIEHIIKNTKGIFVCKRDLNNFLNKIDYIINNYHFIQKQIIKNSLPKKKVFIRQLRNILN
jgi:glycosyltransferase involved in cell wall biosynthesis